MLRGATSPQGKLQAMSSSSSAQRSAMLSERLLIMKLITSVGLALLLLLGVAAAGHAESDEAASVPLAVTVLVDPHANALGDEAAGAIAEHAAVVDGSPGTSALAGAALCILGVLCGLVFAVFTRRMWRRPALPDRGLRPHAAALPCFPVVRLRATVLTLTQLSLSRT